MQPHRNPAQTHSTVGHPGRTSERVGVVTANARTLAGLYVLNGRGDEHHLHRAAERVMTSRRVPLAAHSHCFTEPVGRGKLRRSPSHLLLQVQEKLS